MRKRFIGILLIAVLFFVDLAFAETIMLKSGQKVEGKIIEKTDKYVRLDFFGVPLTYYLDDIESIDGKILSLSPEHFSSATSAQKKDAQDIFAEVKDAIVYIAVRNLDGSRGTGSGFIVDKSGLVLTNFHVVSAAKEIDVKLKDNSVYPVNEIINFDAKKDFCLLKINAPGELSVVALGDSEALKIGEKIYCVGNPLGLEYSFSDGMLSGIREFDGIKWLQFTAPVSPGNSGGPLINSKGEVVGMVTFFFERGQNLNFSLSINEVRPFISNQRGMPMADFVTKVSQSAYALGTVWQGQTGGAQDEISGTYNIVRGVSPDKSTYQGTVDIINHQGVYELIWRIPGIPMDLGVGIVIDNILCAGLSAVNSSGIGIVVYKVEKGRLKGQWATFGSSAIGKEILEGQEGLAGEYKIVDSYSPQSSSAYPGKVMIEKKGEVYFLTWVFSQESYHIGVGILKDGLLIACWGINPTSGVIFYQIKDGTLEGKWAPINGIGLGSETLSKVMLNK